MAERLTSEVLVKTLISEQQIDVAELKAAGVYPSLDIVTTQPNDGAIQTYFRSKRKHTGLVGVQFEDVPCADENEAILEIEKRNIDPKKHATVVQLPLANAKRTDELCNAVNREKDVDALGRGREIYTLPTSLAAFDLARYHTNGFEGIRPDRVAVRGYKGRLVGSGVMELLISEGFEPFTIGLENENDIETIGKRADLLITATGQPQSILPEYLQRSASSELPFTVIDAGIGGMMDEDGNISWHQDLHPDVFDLSYVRATERKNAVGPLAVANMVSNVIISARAEVYMAHPNFF